VTVVSVKILSKDFNGETEKNHYIFRQHSQFRFEFRNWDGTNTKLKS
jgi:hypothetical protein